MSKSFARQTLEGTQGIFGTLQRTEHQLKLLEDIRILEKEVEQRKRMNYTPEENLAYQQQRFYEIQSEHYTLNEESKAYWQKEADRVKTKYLKAKEKRVNLEALALRRFDLRLKGMTPEERDDLARGFIAGNTKLNEDEADTLGAYLAEDDNREILGKPFRQHVEESGVRRPWEAEDPATFRALQLYDTKYGETTFVHEDGELETEVKIAEMFNGD